MLPRKYNLIRIKKEHLLNCLVLIHNQGLITATFTGMLLWFFQRDREAMTHGWLSGGQALAGITGREGALAPVCRMTETGHGSASLTIQGQAFLVNLSVIR